MQNPSNQLHRPAIFGYALVCGDEHHPFRTALRHENTIKRVAVDRRQVSDTHRVPSANRQLLIAVRQQPVSAISASAASDIIRSRPADQSSRCVSKSRFTNAPRTCQRSRPQTSCQNPQGYRPDLSFILLT